MHAYEIEVINNLNRKIANLRIRLLNTTNKTQRQLIKKSIAVHTVEIDSWGKPGL